MNWIRRWLDRRRVKALKRRLARMKDEAQQAELPPLMPAMETISRRIRLERIGVLEKAVDRLERPARAGGREEGAPAA